MYTVAVGVLEGRPGPRVRVPHSTHKFLIGHHYQIFQAVILTKPRRTLLLKADKRSLSTEPSTFWLLYTPSLLFSSLADSTLLFLTYPLFLVPLPFLSPFYFLLSNLPLPPFPHPSLHLPRPLQKSSCHPTFSTPSPPWDPSFSLASDLSFYDSESSWDCPSDPSRSQESWPYRKVPSEYRYYLVSCYPSS